MEFTISYLAVLTAGIASMAIGALWYSPFLFGKLWMALSGLSEGRLAELKARGMGKLYAVNLAAALVMAYVLAHFVQVWGVFDVSGVVQLAFWTWLGLIATTLLGSVLWEGKPILLYIINVSYHLVSLFAMTAILAWWG
jgi:hypothetical protein